MNKQKLPHRLLAPLPVTAFAEEGILSNIPSFTLNSSRVAFGGYGWYVVGNETGGVNPLLGNITLLSIDNFGHGAFRKNGDTPVEDWTQ